MNQTVAMTLMMMMMMCKLVERSGSPRFSSLCNFFL